MKSCAETLMRGFSDRLSVLVPSPYAYQNAFPLLRALTLAVSMNAPLLFKGNDFMATDVRACL
jgi:hypothetical protein